MPRIGKKQSVWLDVSMDRILDIGIAALKITTDEYRAATGAAGNVHHGLADQGNTLVVGAQFADAHGNDSGLAYAFERRNESWHRVAVLSGTDAKAGDQFGLTVSVSGQTPNGQTITFKNRKDTQDPPCDNCRGITPTPTVPTTPTTPPTTVVPPTNTPVPPVIPPVTQVAGEKTPGASATPIADAIVVFFVNAMST